MKNLLAIFLLCALTAGAQTVPASPGVFSVSGSGGGSGSGTVSSGTTNTLAKYTAATTVGNSLASDDGTTLTYTGTGGVSSSGPVAAGVGGTTAGALVLKQGTTQSTGTTNITLQAPTSVTSYILTYPTVVPANNTLLSFSTSGTTATLAPVTALPNGTTATTQSAADNSTKVATTAYADAAVAAGVTASSTTTFTNKRVTARTTTITSSATPTINTDNCDVVTITAQAAAITSMTSSLSGTPVNFDQLEIRIKDDGTARGITWGASYASGIATLPTTTILGKALSVYLEWDSVQTKWMCQSTGSYP